MPLTDLMTPTELTLFYGPLAIAIGIAAMKGVQYEMWLRKQRIVQLTREAELAEDRRRHAEARLPDGCAYVCQGSIPLENHNPPKGSVMVMMVGTPAVKQGVRLLTTLDEMGLSALVGSAAAFDLDSMMRSQFDNDLPAVYKDRVVACVAAAFEPGLSGRTPDEVRAYIAEWGPYVQSATSEAIQLHLRRTGTRPSEIILFLSLGGHAFLGVVVIDTLHEKFSETQLIGHIDLPNIEDQRANLPVVFPLYQRAGLKGMVISDSLSADSITNDTAVIHFIAGALAAALQSGQSMRLNNIHTYALPRATGGILAYQYSYSELVAQEFQPCHCGCLPSRFYVRKDHLFEEVKLLLRTVEEGRAISSIDVPLGQEGRTVYDLILAAVGPSDLRDLEDHLKQAGDLGIRYPQNGNSSHTLYGKENYRRIFASISPPINANNPMCQLAVIRLIAVNGGPDNLPMLIAVPRKRSLPDSSLRVSQQYQPVIVP